MPLFRSFDDAWAQFAGGGELQPLAGRREQFTAGRAQFLSFQAPLAGTPLVDAALDAQDQLAGLAGLDLVPAELLHISILGLGFQVIAQTRHDEILPDAAPQVSGRARNIIAGTPPIEVAVGPPNVFPDAVILEVHDGGALGALRARLDVPAGGDALGYGPEEYLPHITVATFRDASPAAELRERLATLRALERQHATIRRVELARWWFTGADAADAPELDVVQSYLLRG
jgi:2'-5' RNA ligase